jgi:hypothetical protein
MTKELEELEQLAKVLAQWLAPRSAGGERTLLRARLDLDVRASIPRLKAL